MTHQILSSSITSISELKKNPMAVLKKTQDDALAILNHNKPVGYCLSPEAYEAILDVIDDIKLVEIIHKRSKEKNISIDLNDL